VRRSVFAWLVAAALAAMGSLWAHAVAYDLVAAEGAAHARLLATTGHGYLERLPLVLGVLGAVVLLALVLRVVTARYGRPSASPPAWPFALAPAAGFAVQEHVERLLHDGVFPLAAALEPTFFVGLLLQVPFALAALLVARALLRGADLVVRMLGASPAEMRPRARVRVDRPRSVELPRRRPLAAHVAGRGPPLLAA
jgi:hypothetical protein